MKRERIRLTWGKALGFGISVFAWGCEKPVNQTIEGRTGSVPQADATANPRVTLTIGGERTLASMLEGHRGEVVLVDFWATWCVPCVLAFPHTVELSQRYRERGLATVSVSMNEPSDRASVLAFFTKANAEFENLLTEYGAGAEFVDAFELRGDIPCYKLYDRKGALRYVFSSDPEGLEHGEPMERMDQRIEELLAETAK
jgi:thiol-disulfide isomerase/thioredoxin